MNRRGVTGQTLLWIFVSVAGAVILVFFIRFAGQILGTGEKSTQMESLVQLEEQLTALSGSENTFKMLEGSEPFDFLVSCNGLLAGSFHRTNSLFLFSDPHLTGQQLAVWTKRFRFPFSIGNLFFVSNQDERYVLVYDAASEDFVRSLEIPEIFHVQKIALQDLKLQVLAQTASRFTLVFFTSLRDPGVIFNSFTFKDIRVLEIDENNHRYIIHRKNGETQGTYLNTDLLVGFIFGSENFDCMMGKVYEELGNLAVIYQGKMDALAQKTQDAQCRNIFVTSKQLLASFKDARGQESSALAKQLMDTNTELAKDGCATIY